MGRSCQTKHSSPYEVPSPLPGVIVGIRISVLVKICELGAGVVSALTLPALEGRALGIIGRLSEGGEEAVAGIIAELGAGVVDDREESEGDSLRFLLDMADMDAVVNGRLMLMPDA